MSAPAAQVVRRHRKPRPSRPVRVLGYVVGGSLQATGLVLLNRVPGWDAVPFLSDRTPLVLAAVNASLVATLVANAVYVLHDPPWLRGLGDAVAAVFSLVAALRVWTVFPFDFGTDAVDWVLVARVVLLVAIAGSAIAVVVGLVAAGRGAVDETRRAPGSASWGPRA